MLTIGEHLIVNDFVVNCTQEDMEHNRDDTRNRITPCSTC